MKLALFFTFGISAKLWNEKGLLDREKLIYEQLLKSGTVDKICWITYGTADKEIEKELQHGIEIIPMPKIFNSRIGMYLYSFLIPLIHYRSLKTVDILKTNQMSGSWAAVLTKVLHTKKLIVRTGYTWSLFAEKMKTGKIKFFTIKVIEKLACSFSDSLVVSSPNDLKYLKKNYTFKEKGGIIPNYIDTELFAPLNEKKDDTSICFVGRLNSQKNLLSLLEALIGLPYTLSIIGSGEDKARLSRYAKHNHINVNFLGEIENSKLPAILNKHELFILPSLYEGMPKALLEAMSCALPCIGTDVPGINDLIDHGKNGYLCSTDPQAIKSALIDAFNNRENLKTIGQSARDTVLGNFSLDKILKKEAALYNILLH